jgi:hypothetical protein
MGWAIGSRLWIADRRVLPVSPVKIPRFLPDNFTQTSYEIQAASTLVDFRYVQHICLRQQHPLPYPLSTIEL